MNTFIILLFFGTVICHEFNTEELRQEAYEMFMHGYNSYMNHAFPADELMPLSCKGRVRGVTPSRGDVDDSLGNFSLTLLDTLDTLVVMNEFDEFEKAVNLVIQNVRFDSDLIVSVFETNIRVLGGLISAHIMAEQVKLKFPERLQNYNKDLLKMAVEVGNRLLPAFNTTSGLPYSRINLKFGMLEHLKRQKDTCTACGGTMLLEMAALSRLTGDPIYEKKARKAMDFLWQQRHRSSDLMGTVLNVHSGDWVRRESGIGAGIDSYYEYCLKAYILLGDMNYLERFNKHYDAIMRYVNKGPLFVDVHMHRPTVSTRGYMDSLLAFWPGLQVLKGDVKEAIEMHEMLFQVIQKHKFLPEAFTHDFQVHWAEHPLRPEFVESTYFLYRATKDPHYLAVAKQIMDSINEYVRVPCGFASLKDVRTMSKEDQMESFVLTETFKYLYMIFTDPKDLIFDPDHYVLTTEAHFLPLSMGRTPEVDIPRRMMLRSDEKHTKNYVCANPIDFTKLPTEREEAQLIRERTKMILGELKNLQGAGSVPSPVCESPTERLRAWAFSASNQDHLKELAKMGIELVKLSDGRMHLSHNPANAASIELSKWGDEFMKEMIQLVSSIEKQDGDGVLRPDSYVQLMSFPHLGKPIFNASPAQFGHQLNDIPITAKMAKAHPYKACTDTLNSSELKGKIALVERSGCMFQEKARFVQMAGAIAMIVIDNVKESQYFDGKPLFAMAGDKDSPDDIAIPCVFVYNTEGAHLLKALNENKDVIIQISKHVEPTDHVIVDYLRTGHNRLPLDFDQCSTTDGNLIVVDHTSTSIMFNMRLDGIDQNSPSNIRDQIIEKHIAELKTFVSFEKVNAEQVFYDFFRNAVLSTFGEKVGKLELMNILLSMESVHIEDQHPTINGRLPGPITKIRCTPKDDIELVCSRLSLP